MIRLIASDLDGTLLGEDGRIGDGDLVALRQAHESGVHLVIATGRPARWLDCLDPLKDLAPTVLVSNGAAEVDLATGEVIRSTSLETATIREVAADLRDAFGDVRLALEHGTRFGCEPGWLELTNESMVPEDVPDMSLDLEWDDLVERVHPVVKILALGPARGAESFAAEAARVVGDRAVVTHSAVSELAALLEISAPGVSKASALAAICTERGIEAAEVAAFGDMPNDLEMLTFAGRGFAMANAHVSLRQRFPVVASNVDGGVGATIRRLLSEVPQA